MPEAIYGYETALDPGPDDIRSYRVKTGAGR